VDCRDDLGRALRPQGDRDGHLGTRTLKSRRTRPDRQNKSNAYLRRAPSPQAEFFAASSSKAPNLQIALYDPSTGGCRDGLHPDRPNENQGAESTLSFLMALLEMRRLEEADGTENRTFSCVYDDVSGGCRDSPWTVEPQRVLNPFPRDQHLAEIPLCLGKMPSLLGRSAFGLVAGSALL